MKQPSNKNPSSGVTKVQTTSVWEHSNPCLIDFSLTKIRETINGCKRGGRSSEKEALWVTALTVMDFWKGIVQNVLCLLCALHFNGSTQENGICQHLRSTARACMRLHKKNQNPREINHVTLIESDDKKLLSINESVKIPLININFL